jgi:hypothetical protein
MIIERPYPDEMSSCPVRQRLARISLSPTLYHLQHNKKASRWRSVEQLAPHPQAQGFGNYFNWKSF